LNFYHFVESFNLSDVASLKRNEQFVILLLDAGAPLDGLSNYQLMALVESVAVFNRLVARGVNFTAMRDESGATLCHYVARIVRREVDLRFLVKVCGEDAVRAGDSFGKTPLHWASINNNGLAVRVLVELGADIDRQDNWGTTALINADKNVQSSRVELLLALGADVGVVADSGRTACHFAALFEQPASLCGLVAAGGDLEQPDNKGQTPRMIAAQRNVALPTADEIDAAPSNRQDSTRFGARTSIPDLCRTSIFPTQRIAIVRNHDAFVWRARLVDRVSPMVGNCGQGEALSRPQTAIIVNNGNNKQRDKDTMKK
jgi:hypothetical protein